MSETTSLYSCYADKDGAKLTDFYGWMLPMTFAEGIVGEHRAVRSAAGLFDVSHMGRIRIEGKGCAGYVDRLFTNTIPSPGSRRCRYGLVCARDGGVIDDVLVYPLADDAIELVVNASNLQHIFSWLTAENPYIASGMDVPHITDLTRKTAQIAIQGPKAEQILSRLCSEDLASIRAYRFRTDVVVGDVSVMLSRTGYTGEDGFELYCAAQDGPHLWEVLEEAGKEFGLSLCGLGSRDTLRFEAGMPLYGHELSREITPLEASLSRYVKLDKGDFCGRDALDAMEKAGVPRLRVGLEMIDRSVPRAGNKVFHGGKPCGVVTSGGKCHTESIFAAMALVGSDVTAAEDFAIEIHGKMKQARRRDLPFYRRRRN